MKQVYNYWMPDTDNHFYRMITKRISQGGPPEYQDDVRDAAYKYVTDFDVALDIGANVGEVSLILSRDFGCSTYSVEPEEVEFKCLKLNLEGHNSTFLNNPMWKEETQIPFYSANEELDSSCFETEDYTHIIQKKTVTLSETSSNTWRKIVVRTGFTAC